MGIDYAKYLVTKPVYESSSNIKDRQNQTVTYLSSAQIPEANYYLELGWINGIPQPQDKGAHTHNYDEIMVYWGNDYAKPQTLGAEIEFFIGGQLISFNTTTGIFIPRGVPHGPLTWKSVNRSHMQLSLILGTGSRKESLGKASQPTSSRMLQEGPGFDYEQYVIRSPIREAGAEFIKGRTAPTMTYMSGLHIPGVKNYIEFGWTFDMPVSTRTPGSNAQMPAMAHSNFDELVLHIGGDPGHPQDLGADVEFVVGGQPLVFSTSSALFIPRGLVHGPIKCKKYRKPHIVMAIMLGAGSVKEGWGDSFSEPRKE